MRFNEFRDLRYAFITSPGTGRLGSSMKNYQSPDADEDRACVDSILKRTTAANDV